MLRQIIQYYTHGKVKDIYEWVNMYQSLINVFDILDEIIREDIQLANGWEKFKELYNDELMEAIEIIRRERSLKKES